MGRCNLESANGIDKTVYYLSSHQAAAGHDVRIIQLTRKPPFPVPGVSVESYQPPLPSPAFLPASARDLLFDRSPLNLPPQLVDDLLRDPPDMVHFHHTQVPQAGRISRVLRRAGIPYCVTLHGALAGEARRRRRWIKWVHRVIDERAHLDGAAFLHAISRADAAGARAIALKAPVEIIPNGIDVEAFRPLQVPRLADEYPELRDRFVLLFVGRLDPEQKGLDVLLEALAHSDVELGLALVGPGFRDGQETLKSRARHWASRTGWCSSDPDSASRSSAACVGQMASYTLLVGRPGFRSPCWRRRPVDFRVSWLRLRIPTTSWRREGGRSGSRLSRKAWPRFWSNSPRCHRKNVFRWAAGRDLPWRTSSHGKASRGESFKHMPIMMVQR